MHLRDSVLGIQSSLPRFEIQQTIAGGIVGMAIANSMMARTNRARFSSLLSRLNEGATFTEAMTATYGKPEDVVKAWIGKQHSPISFCCLQPAQPKAGQ